MCELIFVQILCAEVDFQFNWNTGCCDLYNNDSLIGNAGLN